jgi:GntR family transcriptional regulator/MocR family aminotransferase
LSTKVSNATLLSLMLDHQAELPLYRQLYNAMRQSILTNQLSAGTRLPSTRAFAHTLGISRSTVVVAFEQLLYEGYLRGKVGSGTYVEDVLPDEFLSLTKQSQTTTTHTSTTTHSRPQSLSERGKIIATSRVAPQQNWNPATLQQTFKHGVPALHEFPFKLWSQLANKYWLQSDPANFGYTDPAGFRPLRREIASYLQTTRGVHCREEQIIIVAGSQQAINLAAQLLIDPGDDVWIEDPCYLGARGALLSSGAQLIPLPLDAEGIDIKQGMQTSPQARLIYVTPSHQFPAGITMSLSRRLALLHWAEQTGAWILEDDYDGEYRYMGHPLASLQGLDQANRVIYIGTFSKVLFPGLRLGYLVAPPALVDAFTAARAAADRHSPTIDQLVLTEFIREEHFARHIRRMRSLYAERQSILLDAIQKELAGAINVQPHEAGMHLIARLAAEYDDLSIAKLAAKRNIVVTPISNYYFKSAPFNALLLGYTAFNEQEIRTGVHSLARIFDTPSPSTE